MNGMRGIMRIGACLACTLFLAHCQAGPLQQQIDDAVAMLADNTVDPEIAAENIEAALLAAYQTGGADFARESAAASVKALGGNAQTLRRLEKRSSEIPVHLVEMPAEEKATPRNVVLYVNGMFTQYTDFLNNFYSLDSLVRPLHGRRDFNVAGLYNPTGGSWLDDTGEVLIQNVLDWMDVFDKSQKDMFDRRYAQELAYLLDTYDNIVIVAHSQGNFYTQRAIASLPIAQRTRINVIQVGSPASNWPVGTRNNQRVDMIGDIVTCLSGADVLLGAELDVDYSNNLFDFIVNFGMESSESLFELTATVACWAAYIPYATISEEEFFAFHDFNNYTKGEAGDRMYRLVDAFCTDGQPLNEINIAGVWMITDITAETGGRTYDEYHTTMQLYEGGAVEYEECMPYCSYGTGMWSFDDFTNEFYFESDWGAVFEATIVGDSDTFVADGNWSNGTHGTILFVRQGKGFVPSGDVGVAVDVNVPRLGAVE